MASGSEVSGLRETHLSVLVLLGDRVFKLKKPIQLPFVDLRTRAARHQLCLQEVALNRRLAPDVYLGVLDVVDEEGRPCDHLVVMRRMPEDRRLSSLVSAGTVPPAALDDLVDILVRFHAGARRSASITEAASRDAVQQNWDDNLEAIRAAPGSIEPALLAAVEGLARRYLAGRAALWAERAGAGRIVDGHGDLLADDIYLLEDGPRVLDCLEFSERLRCLDVLDEVAFLAMDLERLGAPALGQHVVERYVAASGDTHPASLLHHFIAYRAGVRAKVACVRAAQGAAGSEDEARKLLDLARSHLEAGRVRLVVLGGLPGTGKSTVAAALAAQEGWTVLRSDVVRKELERATEEASGADPDLYGPEHTAATYDALLARARHLLERGETVVLDASWHDERARALARQLAVATHSELSELCCITSGDVAAARIRARASAGGDPSDATPEVAQAMARVWDPWPSALVVDTTGPLEQTVTEARARLASGPP